MLTVLILFGITIAAVALWRWWKVSEESEARDLDPERVEREVYEKLYGERSGALSASSPVEPPAEDGVDAPPLTRSRRPRAPRAQGVLVRRRSIKPFAMLFGGLLAAGVLGLVIAGSLGGSDDGGDLVDQRGGTEASVAKGAGSGGTPLAPSGQIPTARTSEVSLKFRSTGTVWVCLVDADGRAPVNGETLTAGEARGPFDSRAFEVTFGNGSIEMTVDGEPTEIPPLVEPLGYRVTPSGMRRLDPSSQPSCQ